MVAYNKIHQFVEDIANKVHDFSSDAITVALCAAANAPVATNAVLGDLTEIAYTNLSTRVLTLTTSVDSSGTYQYIAEDLVLSASGGAVATFRYIALYNDTPASPLNPLICWYDRGSDVDLADGESITLNFDNVNGVFDIV